MSDSEEEGEILPDCVKDYYCFDHNEELVPLASLRLLWSDDEVMDNVQTQVFLCGTRNDGLHEIRKRVIAWKFELSHAEPEISVLSKDKMWIQLRDPKRSYQDLNKSLLITIHYIHFLNKNPEASEKFLWNNLQKTFSSQESELSKKDLIAHMPLMKEAAARNEDLAKSKYMLSYIDDGLELTGTPKEQCLFSFGGDRLKCSKNTHKEDMGNIEDSLEHTENPHEQSLHPLDGDSLESSETPPRDDTDYCIKECNEDEFADSVCAICDNGGNILSCEGDCMRSFHATEVDGCEGLGFDSDAQVEAIQTFLCENCKFNKHQCFACGKLGSSDRSSGAEVFQCISATCGHYYHPKCVAELLCPDNEVSAIDQRDKISKGGKFTCPAHKCKVCHQIEDSTVHELQFALCRRCPRAYHRRCLPREISFVSSSYAPARAWDDLLPNRVLIYCMKHVIEPELGTPARDHLLFRDQRRKLIKLLFRKKFLSTCRTEKTVMEMPTAADTSCNTDKTADEECWIKKKRIDSARRYLKQNLSSQDDDNNRNSTVKRNQPYPAKEVSLNLGPYPEERKTTNVVRPNNQTKNEKTYSSETTELENRKSVKQNRTSIDNNSGKISILKISQSSSTKKVSFNWGVYALEKRKMSSLGPNNLTENEQISCSEVTEVENREHLKQDRSSNKNDNCENSVVKRSQPYPASNLGPDTLKRRKTCFPGRVGSNNHTRDERTSSLETTEMQNRIRNLIRESDASFDVEEFLRKRNITSTSSNAMMIKNITSGKVQQYVEATKAALQILETGGTIDEAKAICDPSVVLQLVKWKTKLRVYMAPFLSGPRYSSFGRHFTKLEKLKEIADRLKWYIQCGDTIVDFCCGSNDFSCLMKEKLDEIEKPCSFKNYDLFPPQNNFCFERRDWHTVDVKELPDGSKLIMGLNPPFGVKASLANKFIDKALQFKPKILILIVPDETRNLGTGPNPYDLIWKDCNLLHGKAFYIPGSTDKRNQKMEDWNVNPPGVYLWSRPDWSLRHKALAKEYGHKDGTFHNAAKVDACNLKRKGVPNAPPSVTNEMPPEPLTQLAEESVELHEAGACGKDMVIEEEDSGMSIATSSALESESSLEGSEAVEPSNQVEVSVELHVTGACGKDTENKEDSDINIATSSLRESKSSVEGENSEAADPSKVKLTNQAEVSSELHVACACGKDIETKRSTMNTSTSYPPKPENALAFQDVPQPYQEYSNPVTDSVHPWRNYQQPTASAPAPQYFPYENFTYHQGPSYYNNPYNMFTYMPYRHHYPLYQSLPPPPPCNPTPPPLSYPPPPQPHPPEAATYYPFEQT